MALTDIIQVVLLVAGGLMIAVILLEKVSGDAGVINGFVTLMETVPDRFDMILAPDHPHYMSLPGLSVLIGGMWVMNVSYWGFNQYIIQRALAAKSVSEAQKGIAFAAFLKLLMPLIVVLPGIAMFALNADLAAPDQAYPQRWPCYPRVSRVWFCSPVGRDRLVPGVHVTAFQRFLRSTCCHPLRLRNGWSATGSSVAG